MADIAVALARHFDQHHILIAIDEYLPHGQPIARRLALHPQLVARAAEVGLGSISVQGVTGPEQDGSWDADWDIVSPDYFTTVAMEIVEDRAFTAADREGAPRVTVLNQTFARRLFPGRSAVGQQVTHQSGRDEVQPLTVVGVAADAKYRYVSDDPRNFIYVPLAQQAFSEFSLFVRHAAGRPVAADIRSAMTQVEPNVPIVILQSFDDAVAVGLLPQRLTAWIAGSVGASHGDAASAVPGRRVHARHRAQTFPRPWRERCRSTRSISSAATRGKPNGAWTPRSWGTARSPR